MTLPWETAPVPVVARNPETGETVRVDVSEDLREAIKTAINSTVMEHRPELVGVAKAHPTVTQLAVEFAERTLLHGAGIDVAVAIAAVLATVTAPDSTLTHALWIITACLAAKTLVQAGAAYATGMVNR